MLICHIHFNNLQINFKHKKGTQKKTDYLECNADNCKGIDLNWKYTKYLESCITLRKMHFVSMLIELHVFIRILNVKQTLRLIECSLSEGKHNGWKEEVLCVFIYQISVLNKSFHVSQTWKHESQDIAEL